MKWRNTASRYGYIAVALHWIIVAGIIAQYVLAEAAEDREPTRAGAMGLMDVHNLLGVTILALALLRIVWRFVEPPPTRPPTMKRYEIRLAQTMHAAFYVLLLTIPISGWALATVDGQSLSYFGLFDLPPLRFGAQLPVEGGRLNEGQLEELHETLFNILIGLALLHALAALKHHFFDRDGIMRSMLPGED